MLEINSSKTYGMNAYKRAKSEMDKLGMIVESVSDFHFIARIPGVKSKSVGLGRSKRDAIMDLHNRIRKDLMKRC